MTDNLITLPRPNCKDLERFFSKIRISTEKFYKGTPCWEWTAGLTKSNYPRFKFKGKTRRAHRVAYAWFVGPIPAPDAEDNIDHRCNNSICVNTAHLEIENAIVNTMRGQSKAAQNGRKTECLNGHPLEGDNLRITAKGYRECRACQRQRMRDYRVNSPEFRAQQAERWQVYYAKNKERLNKRPPEQIRRKLERRKQKAQEQKALKAANQQNVVARPS